MAHSTELPTHVGCGLIICLRTHVGVPLPLSTSSTRVAHHVLVPGIGESQKLSSLGLVEGNCSGPLQSLFFSRAAPALLPSSHAAGPGFMWLPGSLLLSNFCRKAPDRPGASVAPPLLSEAPGVPQARYRQQHTKREVLGSLVLLAGLLCFNIPVLPGMHCVRPPEDLVNSEFGRTAVNRTFHAEQTMLLEAG